VARLKFTQFNYWLNVSLVTGSLVISAPVFAALYTFQSLQDSTGAYSQPSEIGVNNNGDVIASWLTDTGRNAIVQYSSGGSRVVAQGGASTDGPYFNVAYPSQNDAGQVAYYAVSYASLSWQVNRDTAGTNAIIAQYSSTQAPGNGLGISSSGTLEYKIVPTSGSSSIVRDNGTTTTLVTNNTNGFTSILDATMNDSGQIAFKGKRNNEFGIYITDGQSVTTVADTSGPILDVFSGQTPINNSGQAVFSATMDDQSQSLYIGDRNTLTKVADTSGPFSAFSWSSINNNGDVAFIGTLDSGSIGLFTGADPVKDKVIAIGDPLFGSTVSQLILYHGGLNDNGDVAFRYRLSSGVYGVAIAAPEPTGMAVIGIATALGLLRRRRK
jgi:hypothetical protein